MSKAHLSNIKKKKSSNKTHLKKQGSPRSHLYEKPSFSPLPTPALSHLHKQWLSHVPSLHWTPYLQIFCFTYTLPQPLDLHQTIHHTHTPNVQATPNLMHPWPSLSDPYCAPTSIWSIHIERGEGTTRAGQKKGSEVEGTKKLERKISFSSFLCLPRKTFPP